MKTRVRITREEAALLGVNLQKAEPNRKKIRASLRLTSKKQNLIEKRLELL